MPYIGSTTKDIEITTCALLKSVIESGALMDDWEMKTKRALNLYSQLVSIQLKKKNAQ